MSKLKTLRSIFNNVINPCTVAYIVEPGAWTIHNVGMDIVRHFRQNKGRVVTTPIGLRGKVWHFGSVNSFYHHRERIKKNHPCIVTWYHLVPDDPRTQKIIQCDHLVSKWHTASSRTKRQLIQAGLPEEKITLIPLGIDRKFFFPVSQEDKAELRKSLGLPGDRWVIGSFQKDGNGWGEGNEPKLIKGPDIFCDVVEKLAKHVKLHILLSGPSRGYVKNRLEKAGIPFSHKYFDNSTDVSLFYQASDLYMITSREEGGPIALLESLATRTPLVCGHVGMVDDIVHDQEEALVVDWNVQDEAVEKILSMMQNEKLRMSMQDKGEHSVECCNWQSIADRHVKELYASYL